LGGMAAGYRASAAGQFFDAASRMGLAGLDYQDRALGQNTALGQDQLRFMNSVNIGYPDAASYQAALDREQNMQIYQQQQRRQDEAEKFARDQSAQAQSFAQLAASGGSPRMRPGTGPGTNRPATTSGGFTPQVSAAAAGSLGQITGSVGAGGRVPLTPTSYQNYRPGGGGGGSQSDADFLANDTFVGGGGGGYSDYGSDAAFLADDTFGGGSEFDAYGGYDPALWG
jgi:hypothetical protein